MFISKDNKIEKLIEIKYFLFLTKIANKFRNACKLHDLVWQKFQKVRPFKKVNKLMYFNQDFKQIKHRKLQVLEILVPHIEVKVYQR